MDELRARALLDLLLGQDSRPRGSQPAGSQPGTPGQPGPAPCGFASRVTLTAPLATLTRLADRPGELSGLGPVDPWLTRDLATAAAANPRTTWCLTVTDSQGHAVAHGCARPEPRSHTATRRPRPAGLRFHARQPGRPARRLRHLAAAHPRTRTGPDHHDRPDHHRPLRSPSRDQPPRPRGQAPAPGPGPARHLHQPHLPPARRPVRPRAQHPLRSRRPHAASATPAPSAATTTASSSTPGGEWTSSPTGPSAGPPRPDGPTTPNPRATRSRRAVS